MDSVTITNASGCSMTVLAYGGTIQRLEMPDRNGKLDNIVLGFANPADYANHEQPYFGATIGRFGGRIGDARFTLDGTDYQLGVNNNGHSLHGGTTSFSHVVWDLTQDGQKAILHRVSPDGEDGYPGNLDVSVTYELTDANELRMDFVATTDQTTVLNLTNHSYFNLKGEGNDDVLDHVATINADVFLPIDDTLIPTGELCDVTGTPFDFRQAKPFRDGFTDGTCDQIVFGHGWDITYQVNRGDAADDELVDVCHVEEPTTGRSLSLATTEPGVQFYTGSTLDSTYVGASGRLYQQAAGFCFETQHFPDSPNKPEFPSTVLNPGETYRHVAVFTFSVA